MQTRMILRMTIPGLLAVMVFARPGFAVDIVDDPVQIDERAAQVLDASNSLCWEMHRYHQMQPNYKETYRTAKEIWAQAGALRDALRAGRMETGALAQQAAQMNDAFTRLEQDAARWGDGDRSQVPLGGPPTQRTVVTPGVAVDVPFVGVRLGRPRYVVTEDGPPVLERLRLHPNSRGSKRSLERELAALKVAVSYLMEDAGTTDQPAQPPRPSQPPTPPRPAAASGAAPVPNPPDEGPTLGEPVKVVPKSARK